MALLRTTTDTDTTNAGLISLQEACRRKGRDFNEVINGYRQLRPATARRSRAGKLAATICIVVLWCLLCAFVTGLVFGVAGCASSEIDQRISQANQTAKLQAARAKAQSKVDVAKVNAKAAVDRAKANHSPVSHPLTSTNQTTKRLQKPWEIIATIAGIAFAVFVGLCFTPFSAVSKLGMPIAGAVAAIGYLNVITLPFLPWVLLGAAVLLLTLIIYELVRYKSISKAATAIGADLGFNHSSTSPAASTSSSLTTSPNSPSGASSLLTSVENDAKEVLTGIGSKLQPIEAEIKKVV